MEKYYALDFINDCECELVYGDQLYATEAEAEAAREATERPELFDITWYTLNDLEDDVYTVPFEIDDNLHVNLLS